jgi:hypothetical protein
MVRSPRVWLATALLLALSFAPTLLAEPPPARKPEAKTAPSKFIRIKRDARDQPVALETAIARYVSANGEGGLVVDLIGAVHVADRSYYEALNNQFEQYDVLLYELVAPQGTRIPKGGKRDQDNPIAMLQKVMTQVLALDAQVEHVDYTKKNFVHADLSPAEMAEAIRKRGDTGFTLFLSIMADLLRQQNLQELNRKKSPSRNEPEMDLFALLLDPNSAVKLKRLMAEQFEALSSPGTALGNTLTTILISDRNQAAMKVFQKELARGKKKVGIFYGAAHLPDFEKRLREDFGLKKESERWLSAWDLREKRGGLEEILNLFGK